MSIDHIQCAYINNFTIKINHQNQEILASQWLVKLSDGSWKKYQVTTYNQFNKTKKRTLSKTFSKRTLKTSFEDSSETEETKTTYIQINNLEQVKLLQERSDTIKIKVKINNSDIKDHCIDPNSFVDTKKDLFPVSPFNYFKIKEYLREYVLQELSQESQKKAQEMEEPEPSATSDGSAAAASQKHAGSSRKRTKATAGVNQENSEVSSTLATTSTKSQGSSTVTSSSSPLQNRNTIKPISICSNLKLLTGIIFVVVAVVIANFYNSKEFNFLKGK